MQVADRRLKIPAKRTFGGIYHAKTAKGNCGDDVVVILRCRLVINVYVDGSISWLVVESNLCDFLTSLDLILRQSRCHLVSNEPCTTSRVSG